ncbi:hypothetical protein G4B88_025070 [Cannabis sativa]|uniref:Uncharacterized protein n=1 Tax=Cannabis sativa TaxID=3483 RepID=A0A7J6EI19_CANSA|nr:hypothetical protein G4B88_017075 [Cannabis sativa]KAF4368148.1 hypothetical protein G4B88_025070 [Cannabis sativa]
MVALPSSSHFPPLLSFPISVFQKKKFPHISCGREKHCGVYDCKTYVFTEQPWIVSALKSMDEGTKMEFLMTLHTQCS